MKGKLFSDIKKLGTGEHEDGMVDRVIKDIGKYLNPSLAADICDGEILKSLAALVSTMVIELQDRAHELMPDRYTTTGDDEEENLQNILRSNSCLKYTQACLILGMALACDAEREADDISVKLSDILVRKRDDIKSILDDLGFRTERPWNEATD